jgi:hypothetical protein
MLLSADEWMKIESTASYVASKARTDGYWLDFSEQSLEELDRMFSKNWGDAGPSEESRDLLVYAFGSYVAVVINAHYAGAWDRERDDGPVNFTSASGLIGFNPWNWIVKRFDEGDSIYEKYSTITKMVDADRKTDENANIIQYTKNVIVTLAVSLDLPSAKSEDDEIVYSRASVSQAMQIMAIGSRENHGRDVQISHLLIADADGDLVFIGSPDKFLRDDDGDEESASLIKTIIVTLGLVDQVGEDFAFELADFLENLLIWINPESALGYLEFENEFSIGSDELTSSGNYRCFVSRFVGVVEELVVDDSDVGSYLNSIQTIEQEADFDDLSQLDLTLLIK